MKISDVSEQMEMSIDTLRYYEKEGLITNIERINGIRHYTENDLKRIEFVKCLRIAGVSIDSLRNYLALVDQGDKTSLERKNILINERDRILEEAVALIDVLDLINTKIHNYESRLLIREDELLGAK